jgi:hypothetical protein
MKIFGVKFPMCIKLTERSLSVCYKTWISAAQFHQDTSPKIPVTRNSFMTVVRTYPNVTLIKY